MVLLKPDLLLKIAPCSPPLYSLAERTYYLVIQVIIIGPDSSVGGRSGEREVLGSIPGRDIPKSLKMVLAAPLHSDLRGRARTRRPIVRILWMGVVLCQVSWA